MKKILILGAGATSQEIAEILHEQARQGADLELLGFLDDNQDAPGVPELGIRVLGPTSQVNDYPDVHFVLGIASYAKPTLRRDLTKAWGLSPDRYHTVIHPSAQVSPTAHIEPGCILMHNVLINRCVRLESQVLIAQGACINHDSHIGRYSVIAPGVILCGRTVVGESVYIGAGATTSPGVEIGSEALVGIGSVVLQSVAESSTVFGNPARVLQKGGRERWTP